MCLFFFFFKRRRRHTKCSGDWSSDVCSSDLIVVIDGVGQVHTRRSDVAHRESHASGELALNIQDRKSTRLNSSHGYISYAVFCLKKKKKEQQHHTDRRPTHVEVTNKGDYRQH